MEVYQWRLYWALSCLAWFSTQLIPLSLFSSCTHALLATIFNIHSCFLLITFGLIGNEKKKRALFINFFWPGYLIFIWELTSYVQDLQEWVERVMANNSMHEKPLEFPRRQWRWEISVGCMCLKGKRKVEMDTFISYLFFTLERYVTGETCWAGSARPNWNYWYKVQWIT